MAFSIIKRLAVFDVCLALISVVDTLNKFTSAESGSCPELDTCRSCVVPARLIHQKTDLDHVLPLSINRFRKLAKLDEWDERNVTLIFLGVCKNTSMTNRNDNIIIMRVIMGFVNRYDLIYYN